MPGFKKKSGMESLGLRLDKNMNTTYSITQSLLRLCWQIFQMGLGTKLVNTHWVCIEEEGEVEEGWRKGEVYNIGKWRTLGSQTQYYQ